ncbi:hypothetical protein N7481_009743 [Penicillium waksmanii]|uniref:uncharacterized protein n=1 Tax=Penicillium waksmanii TaxID=69791 RepID=UPI0025488EC0|nr:uncharacterized protein N7481_009743 [Penicillium waksmanii]KAJ5976036.1 hypothetical protein N7481_009743 [Penicillium waksmanii]
MSPAPAATASTAATTSFVASGYSTSDNFQGWYLQTTPEPIVCGSTETFYTSSTYGDCYNPSSSVPMPTGCDGATLLYEDSLQAGCPTSYSCSAYKIFPTEGSDAEEAILKYGCLFNWGADSIYRSLPARFASSTAAPEVTATASISATTDTSTHHTATSTSTGSAANSTSNSDSASSGSDSGLSSGGIAGIVVGCVALIAIILLLVFRKKVMALFRKDSPAEDKGPWSEGSLPPQTQPASQTGSALPASEMSADYRPVHEIGSSPPAHSESQEGSTWKASEMSSDYNSVYEIGSSQQNATRPVVVHELS